MAEYLDEGPGERCVHFHVKITGEDAGLDSLTRLIVIGPSHPRTLRQGRS